MHTPASRSIQITPNTGKQHASPAGPSALWPCGPLYCYLQSELLPLKPPSRAQGQQWLAPTPGRLSPRRSSSLYEALPPFVTYLALCIQSLSLNRRASSHHRKQALVFHNQLRRLARLKTTFCQGDRFDTSQLHMANTWKRLPLQHLAQCAAESFHVATSLRCGLANKSLSNSRAIISFW